MEAKKRLFVAINLPIELKRSLFEIQKKINSQLSEEQAEAQVFKWVAMENLHLTLRFIGEVGDSQIPKIIESIEDIVRRQKPFEIKTKEICYDDPKAPRLIWLEIEKSRSLEGLARDLGGGRNFRGHITLARIKEWAFNRIELDERPSIGQDLRAMIPAVSIELMESALKRAGPEYKIIKSFNLSSNI